MRKHTICTTLAGLKRKDLEYLAQLLIQDRTEGGAWEELAAKVERLAAVYATDPNPLPWEERSVIEKLATASTSEQWAEAKATLAEFKQRYARERQARDRHGPSGIGRPRAWP